MSRNARCGDGRRSSVTGFLLVLLLALPANASLASSARAATAQTVYYITQSPNLARNITRISPDRTGKLNLGSAIGDDSPRAIAVDGTGKIYVANENTRTVKVFAPGSNGDAPPIAIIGGPDTGLLDPYGIAFDGKGRIDVLDFECFSTRTCGASVLVFRGTSNGDVVPVERISTPASLFSYPSRPAAIAADKSGNIFLTGSSDSLRGGYIAIIPAGAAGVSSIVKGPDSQLQWPSAIAVDQAGNVYVAEQLTATSFFGYRETGGAIAIFAPSLAGGTITYSAPSAIIFGDQTNLLRPNPALALDASGTMYTMVYAGVGAFIAGSDGDTAPFGILNGFFGALAADEAGNVYTAIDSPQDRSPSEPRNEVNVYPAGSYGHVSPIGQITPPQVGQINAAAVDKEGNVWVSGGPWGSNQPELREFAPSATDSAPINSINLPDPGGIAVAPDGTFYLSTYSNGVYVYAPGSSGNAIPVRHINDVRLPSLVACGIAVDAKQNLYVYECGHRGPASNTLSAIAAFAANADGDAAPSAVITGPHTGVDYINAMAFDDVSGSLLVSTLYDPVIREGAILSFPPGSNGDVAPRTVVRRSGGFVGIVTDSAGRMFTVTGALSDGAEQDLAVFSSRGVLRSLTPLPIEGDFADFPVGVAATP